MGFPTEEGKKQQDEKTLRSEPLAQRITAFFLEVNLQSDELIIQ
jgi:hypothetical protein